MNRTIKYIIQMCTYDRRFNDKLDRIVNTKVAILAPHCLILLQTLFCLFEINFIYISIII